MRIDAPNVAQRREANNAEPIGNIKKPRAAHAPGRGLWDVVSVCNAEDSNALSCVRRVQGTRSQASSVTGASVLALLETSEHEDNLKAVGVELATPGVPAALLMPGQGVFAPGVMIAFDDVAFSISRLVAVEVVVGVISARRHRSFVTMTRIKSVIDMAGEMRRAVEPGASSNKHTADKPIRPVVTVGRAVIRRVVEVTIGAHGRRTNSNVDGDLGWLR
jgi:hypothetical protein